MSWYKAAIKKILFTQRYILADRKDYLINKLGIPEHIVNWAWKLAIQIEPRGSFIQWIANQAIKNNVIMREDDSKITEKLSLFHKLSKNKKIDQRDINKFKTYGELARYLEPYTMQSAESGRESEKRLTTQGAVPVHKNENVEVVRLDTEQAAAQLCRRTEWCIKDPMHFNDYGPPFYLFYFNEKPHALLHAKSGQFKDVYDDSIGMPQIAPIVNAIQSFMEKDPSAINLNEHQWGSDLEIIPEAIKKKKIVNDKIEQGNENAIVQGLSKDINAYHLIDNKNKTENIMNVAAKEYENSTLEDLDYMDEMEINLNDVRQSFEMIRDIPKELLQRYSLDTFGKIKEFATNQFEDNYYNYHYFSDNVKNIIGQDQIMEMWLDRIRKFRASDLEHIPEEIYNSIPEDKKIDLIHNEISQSIINDYRAGNVWDDIPDFIKNDIPVKIKQELALDLAQKSMTRDYHTIGQSPAFPQGLIQYIPEDQRLKAWSRMLNVMPGQINMVPEEIRGKIDKQELAKGWMHRMSYHSISTYPEIPEDIKPLIPMEYVKEKFIQDLSRKYQYMHTIEGQWNLVRQVLNDQEIQMILNEEMKKFATPMHLKDGPFYGGRDANKYFAEINQIINKLPLMYRQQLFDIVEQIRKEIEIGQQAEMQVSGSISKNWYKRSQFDYIEDEDRNTISSPQGSIIVTETYPRYEFLEDLTFEEFEVLGLDEDEPIAKIEHLEVDIISRGLGYGGKLLAEAIEKAKGMGVNFIYLNACPMGLDANSLSLNDLTIFYQKYGFFVFKRQGNNNLMGLIIR